MRKEWYFHDLKVVDEPIIHNDKNDKQSHVLHVAELLWEQSVLGLNE